MNCEYSCRCAYEGELDECLIDPEECKYFEMFQRQDRRTLVEVAFELERLRELNNLQETINGKQRI